MKIRISVAKWNKRMRYIIIIIDNDNNNTADVCSNVARTRIYSIHMEWESLAGTKRIKSEQWNEKIARTIAREMRNGGSERVNGGEDRERKIKSDFDRNTMRMR